MPYRFLATPDLIEFQVFGVLRIEDLLAAAKETAEIERTAPVSPHRITDLSRADDLDMTFSKMADFAALRRAAPLKNNVRSAIVATKQVQVGFARMYQTLNDNPQIEVRIFNNYQVARAWVEGKPLGADEPGGRTG